MKRQRNQQSMLRRQPARLIQAVRRRQLPPFLFRMGPVTLSMCSVLLISLMAVLYLSQLGQAVTTNQQLQDLRAQQALLERQNNDLLNTVAQEQSPTYIAAHAVAMGLAPANTQNEHVVIIPHLRDVVQDNQP